MRIEVIVFIYIFPFALSEFICNKNETLKLQLEQLQTVLLKTPPEYSVTSDYFHEVKIKVDENDKQLIVVSGVAVHNKSMIAIKINGVFIGRGHMNLYVPTQNGTDALLCRIRFIVSSPFRTIDKIFNAIVFVLVVIVSLFMGALLNFKLLIEQIKHPVALLVGFFTQYLLMPLLAFAITQIFRYPHVQSIGLFIVGCAPGGTNSNQWTVLLDGDIDLSAVMTFISTLSSLFMMPLWLLTLGKYYTKRLNIKIPYLILARNLFLVIVPYTGGITLTHFFPKMKRIVQKLVKPLVIFLIIFFTGVGTYVNSHLFKMLRWYHAITAPLLPWCGFIMGTFIAYLCRLPRKQIVTVGIETGFQNVGIAMLITQTNFISPEKEMSSVIVLITGILSSFPLWFIYFIILCVKKNKIRKARLKNTENDVLNENKKFLNESEIEKTDKDEKLTPKLEQADDNINESTSMLSKV